MTSSGLRTVPDDAQDLPGPSDAELIAAVRGGDTDAYGELYQRHCAAAYGLARQLASSPSGADDLVAEAFAKVLESLRNGRGPDSAFRAYLLTTLRHGLYDSTRKDKRLSFSDDLTAVDPGTPFVDTPMRDLEASLVARAFAALPERWQTVLWHTEIEGQRPADVAPLLGLTANGAAALAYRAREGLRQAYLQAHLAESAEDDCRYTVERLGAWARDGLAKREKAKVQEHLHGCARCSALSGELVDVNSGLRAIIAPLVLGAPFVAGYLASLDAGAGGAGGASPSAPSAPGGSTPQSGGAAGGETAGGSNRSRSRIGVLVAAAVALLIAGIAGVAFAVSRPDGDESPTSGRRPILATEPPVAGTSPSPTAVGPSPGPAASTAPGTSISATPVPATSIPATSAPVTSAPAPTPTPESSAPEPEPPPAPTDLPTSADVPVQGVAEPAPPASPQLAPLTVAVSLNYIGLGQLGQSGVLSGAVGQTPQVRLLEPLPPGWSASILGPCLEGAGATTVCTMPGAQGLSALTVQLTPPPRPAGGPVSVTIGLFAEAGDAAPVDSF